MNIVIKNADILNEGQIVRGNVRIENDTIAEIFTDNRSEMPDTQYFDAHGKLLLPGIIDDQVHFRQPGLTHKGDIFSESRAAAAGGITSFMDMPNTLPPTLDSERLDEKFELARQNSLVNYSFYLGASNDNIAHIRRIDPKTVCGVKVFMGSSTGNMLVDDERALSAIFAESPVIVATHCEDENIIREKNLLYRQKYGDSISPACHPQIRTDEACRRSSAKAIELAIRYNTRLHVLHLTTAGETEFFDRISPAYLPRVTAEVCVHHLWFCSDDYAALGNKIKCNPAIKTAADREALQQAVRNGKIAAIATDHAPHTLDEKLRNYCDAPSGLPLVQHSLPMMLELCRQGVFSLFDLVEMMCHRPAKLFNIKKRGFIRTGYFADLTLVDSNSPNTVTANSLMSKCRWSPLEGQGFSAKVVATWVNGATVWHDGRIIETKTARQLEFER
ncbi:MAG: dihydroorotase [Prevotellaceae bacterium]|jgi:dihydroorotase|nr:dihydroorotase [Prevotellaceae bacterium]